MYTLYIRINTLFLLQIGRLPMKNNQQGILWLLSLTNVCILPDLQTDLAITTNTINVYACMCIYNAPVSKAQPEDIVGVETQRLYSAQHQHVANVKLHHSHILSLEQHRIFNVFTHHLQNKTHIRTELEGKKQQDQYRFGYIYIHTIKFLPHRHYR